MSAGFTGTQKFLKGSRKPRSELPTGAAGKFARLKPDAEAERVRRIMYYSVVRYTTLRIGVGYNLKLLFMAARFCKLVSRLHAQQRVGADTECLLEPDRHLGG